MTRINSNVPSLIAQRILTKQNDALSLSLERLSTGMRINKGRDDPAGLIASERMRADLKAIDAAQKNISRAINVVAVAESGLHEISNLINDLEKLVDQSANETAITEDEVKANQLEIDAILESIDRISNTTEFQGRKLLNGDFAYTTSNVNSISHIADLRINAARIAHDTYRSVTVEVTQSAQIASLAYISGTLTGNPRTIEITGNLGTERMTFGSGTTVSQIAYAINQSSRLTGVSAYSSGANYVYFTSTEYGSSEFVRVRELTGQSFELTSPEDYGRDAAATINGMQVVARGLDISVRTAALSADLTLHEQFGTTVGASSSFEITGGGARFAITPILNLNSLASIGIDAVNAAGLGNGNEGYLYTLATGATNDLNSKNFFQSQRIIRAAAMQVASLRGRLGAFEKDTLETTLNSLQVEYENLASAESVIRDTDFAEETANLTRANILVNAAMMVLGKANSAPQNVLTLLQQ